MSFSEAASQNVQNFRHGVSMAVKCKNLARTGGWRVVSYSAHTKNILWLVDSEIKGVRNARFSATVYAHILPSIPYSRDGYVGYLLNT